MSVDREQVSEGLKSTSANERAKAASWLAQNPFDIETRDLVKAIQHETVSQIRRILLQVLEMRQKPVKAPDKPEIADPNISGKSPDLNARTEITDLSALIRHELSAPVGWIKLAADGEIANYAESATSDAIRKLQRRIDGLTAIVKSAEELNLRTVNLPDLLSDSWPDPKNAPEFDLSDGSQPDSVNIRTDEGLFSLLLSNVFQNAIDASIEATGSPAVSVRWGFTERSYWVRVTNPFLGDRLSMGDVVGVGSSSKLSHQGQGLALIRSVSERLKVLSSLEGQSGIASFVLSGVRDHF